MCDSFIVAKKLTREAGTASLPLNRKVHVGDIVDFVGFSYSVGPTRVQHINQIED